MDNPSLKAFNEAWIARDELMIARNEKRIRHNERWMRWFPWSRRYMSDPTDALFLATCHLREAVAQLRSVTEKL